MGTASTSHRLRSAAVCSTYSSKTTTVATKRPHIHRTKHLSTSRTVLIAAHPFHSTGKYDQEDKDEQKEAKQTSKSKNSNNKKGGRLFASFLTKLQGKDNGEGKKKKTKMINPVYAAIASNSVIAFTKLGAFFMTGSATMLSEFVHSCTDVSNQTLLAIGIRASQKEPDSLHPYGYGKERFVWSLISAVGVFFLGCGVTTYHGISTLVSGHVLEDIPVALSVLGVAFVLEGITLYLAFKAVRDGALETNMSVKEYIQYGSDPMSVAVLAEDTTAVVGVVIAAAALMATYHTGNPVYDAVGSIVIGLSMGVVAMWLIQMNRGLLLGTAIPPARHKKIIQLLESDPAVKAVRNIKGEIIEPGKMRFKADIEFNGEAVAKRYLEAKYPHLKEVWKDIKTEEELEQFLVKYGAGLVRSLAKEVDRIEAHIKTRIPGAKYIDLETD